MAPARGQTLPQMLLYRGERDAERVALRHKQHGIWQEFTFRDYTNQVTALSLGLATIGLAPGDRAAVIGETAPQWYFAELAVMAAGGVSLGIYSGASPEEMAAILEHSESAYLFARGQEQVDKYLAVADRLPHIKTVIYWDSRGLEKYDRRLVNLDDLVRWGQQAGEPLRARWQERLAAGQAADICHISYTSGTTEGQPRGALLSHGNLLSASAWIKDYLGPGDDYFAHLSPAGFQEQLAGLASNLAIGYSVNFPERLETLAQDIMEISPRFVIYPPRLLEESARYLEMRMARGKGLRAYLFRQALRTRRTWLDQETAGRRPSLMLRSRGWMARHWLLDPIRNQMGWRRLKVALTGGETLSPATAHFLCAIGVPLMDSYGMSECPAIALSPEGLCHPGTPSRVAPGQEVRISPEGEIMVRGSALFAGYYKDAAATRERVREGWFYTGDAGRLDERGHLIFLDRLPEMLRLEDGTTCSLQHIEAQLRASPFIKDALLAFGRQAGDRLAVISTDLSALSAWANRKGILHTRARELIEKPEVLRLIRQELARIDVSIPRRWRVTRFVLLPFEFDPERQELTRTGKLRRAFLRRRYFSKMPERPAADKEDKSEIALNVDGMGEVPMKVHHLP